MRLSPAAKESAIRLPELDLGWGEMVEGNAASDEIRGVDQQRIGGSAWESNSQSTEHDNRATTHAKS